MLRHVKRLRSIFNPFYHEYERADMLLNDEEWHEID